MTAASREPCAFCREPTPVRIAVTTDGVKAARRICKHCFKAIIDHLMEARPPK